MKNSIQRKMFCSSLGVAIKSLFLLIIPCIFATSSIWLKWLMAMLTLDISTWISDSYNSLVSTFGVLAGAYITLFATYALKHKDEKRKAIASKELAFYIPMLQELIEIRNFDYKRDLMRFTFRESPHSKGLKWFFWSETQNSLLKYSVPQIFYKKIMQLDKAIHEYAKLYIETDSFCIDIAKRITIENGLIDTALMNPYYNILHELYKGEFLTQSVLRAIPNCQNVNADVAERVCNTIRKEICCSQKYNDFISCYNLLINDINEVYEGLDYTLLQIHRKYKGMNKLY